MREWILKNTEVTEEEYDDLINQNTTNITPSIPDTTKYIKEPIFHHPLITIDSFTAVKPTPIRKHKYRVISEKDYYIHKGIKFYILADLIHDMQDILYSNKRNGKCGELSFLIARQLENYHIITAICIDPFNKLHKKTLHTFVLYKFPNNEEYILDATMNVAIEKNTFLQLLQAKIISDIEKETIEADYNILRYIPHLNLAEYLCFRDQVVSGIKKYVKKRSNIQI